MAQLIAQDETFEKFENAKVVEPTNQKGKPGAQTQQTEPSPSGMKYCVNCGSWTPTWAAFCPGCGAPQ